MKALLYIDDYCYKRQGNYYIEEFSVILLNRYLAVFEYVALAIRVKEVDSGYLDTKAKYLQIDNEHVRIIEIPYGRGIIDYIHNFRQTNKSLSQSIQGYDIAIIRIPSIYAFSVLFYVAKHKIPYAVEVVADCYDIFKTDKSCFTKIAWYYMHLLQKRYCKKALGVSYVTKNYLQKHYPSGKDAVVSSYSSIELPKTWYTSNRFFPKKDSFTIVHLSYHVFLNSSKGHRELIDVLAILKNSHQNPLLVFVGNASEDNKKEIIEYAISKGVGEQISFAGFLGRDELHFLLTNVDLAVLPTKSEGLPRVVIEAMAVGLPCVSTRVGGIPELLDEMFLMKLSDTMGFAFIIERLMSDPNLYEKTSKNNYNRSLLYEASELNKKRSDFYIKLKNEVNNKKINN